MTIDAAAALINIAAWWSLGLCVLMAITELFELRQSIIVLDLRY
jgi:hypothetical protein